MSKSKLLDHWCNANGSVQRIRFVGLRIVLLTRNMDDTVGRKLTQLRKGWTEQDLASPYHHGCKDEIRHRGTTPRESQLFLPWNGTLKSLQKVEEEDEKNGQFSDPMLKGRYHVLNEPYDVTAAKMAHLVLLPSPGERFWLVIRCLDDVLNEVQSSVFAEVRLAVVVVYFLLDFLMRVQSNFHSPRHPSFS